MDDILRADVTLNPQGRVVIPAALRKALGFKPGDELIMYVDEGGIRIDTADNIIRRVQDEFAKVAKDRDLVQELLDQRRREQQLSDERFERLRREGQVTERKARSA